MDPSGVMRSSTGGASSAPPPPPPPPPPPFPARPPAAAPARGAATHTPRRHGDVARAACHEVARHGPSGGDEEPHRRVELGHPRQHAAQPLQVRGVLAVHGAQLGDGDARHGGKYTASPTRSSSRAGPPEGRE